jgi:hypothetical protein
VVVSEPRLVVDPHGKGIWLAGLPLPYAVVISNDLALPELPDEPVFPSGRRVADHTWYVRKALVPFENGLGVSMTWGSGTYSDNHGLLYTNTGAHDYGRAPLTERPAEVEVAVVRDALSTALPELLPLGGPLGGVVMPYVPVRKVRSVILPAVSALPSSARFVPLP